MPTALRFNPPPGWDVPSDPAWVPPAGWRPEPWWPPAPAGWVYWVPVDPAGTTPPATRVADHAPAAPVTLVPVTTPVARGPATALLKDPDAPKVPFWSLRVDRSSAIVLAVFLGIALVYGGFVRWDQAKQARQDRFEAGVAYCTQVVRDEFAEISPYVQLDTLGDEAARSSVDGDMVVRISGAAFVGRGMYGYTCQVTNTGQWDDFGGWTVPVVSLSEG